MANWLDKAPGRANLLEAEIGRLMAKYHNGRYILHEVANHIASIRNQIQLLVLNPELKPEEEGLALKFYCEDCDRTVYTWIEPTGGVFKCFGCDKPMKRITEKPKAGKTQYASNIEKKAKKRIKSGKRVVKRKTIKVKRKARKGS